MYIFSLKPNDATPKCQSLQWIPSTLLSFPPTSQVFADLTVFLLADPTLYHTRFCNGCSILPSPGLLSHLIKGTLKFLLKGAPSSMSLSISQYLFPWQLLLTLRLSFLFACVFIVWWSFLSHHPHLDWKLLRAGATCNILLGILQGLAWCLEHSKCSYIFFKWMSECWGSCCLYPEELL